MYGLGSILSSLGTAAAAPALSTATMSAVTDSMKDADWLKGLIENESARNFLSEAAGGTLGTALSMGLGAGLGAATGGSSGAAGGALTGLVSGAGAAMQHDKFKDAMGLGALDKAPQALPQNERPAIASESPTLDYDLSKRVSGIGIDQMKQAPAATPSAPATTPTTAAAAGKGKILDKDKPSYFELTAGLGMPALTLGMGLTSGLQEGQAARAYRKKKQQEEEARLAEIQSLMQRVYGQGYAEGGMTVSNPTNPQTTVKFPQWFVDEFAKSGGLQSLAQGGYINTQEFDPDMAHPQSQIPRAQHYPAAAPIRNEVLDFADGGLLEGDGDGMSDDIPANIEGQEEIRVADGEFIVPKRIAEQYGEDALEDMMDAVRHAVHAKKGKQPQQDAAKRAFIRTMSGIKA